MGRADQYDTYVHAPDSGTQSPVFYRPPAAGPTRNVL
jgi:hypothetical protein